MLEFLVALIINAIIAGYMARLLVPGPDPLTFLQTVLLGIVGNYVGGILGYLIFSTDTDEGLIQTSGIVGSIAGSFVTLVVYNVAWGNRRDHVRHGAR